MDPVNPRRSFVSEFTVLLYGCARYWTMLFAGTSPRRRTRVRR